MSYQGPFRDISGLLQAFRDFLLGRWPHLKHNRFNPLLAPRTLPKPNIPRGPDETNKFSSQYYFTRDPFNTVKPPIEVCARKPASASKKPMLSDKVVGTENPVHIEFPTRPSPGVVYWWDAHCYYESVPDFTPCPPAPRPKIVIDDPPHVRRAKRQAEIDQNICHPCYPNKTPVKK